ncbi:MerR family transcriptional regulator [Paracoccaceae bacterium GXU_MW_L88]
MLMGEVCKRTGLTADTLRFYEKIGLMPTVARDAGGRRRYGPADLRWLEFLALLRATGMPQAQRLHYAQLRAEGDATVTARREMLETQRDAVVQKIADLTRTLGFLDDKIALYRRMENGDTDDNT